MKLRNPFENIIFHILCYIFDSNNPCYSHTQHFWHQLWRLFKGNSSIVKTDKTKVPIRNIYYTNFVLFHSPVCSQRTRRRCLCRRKKGPREHWLAICGGICYISHHRAHLSIKGPVAIILASCVVQILIKVGCFFLSHQLKYTALHTMHFLDMTAFLLQGNSMHVNLCCIFTQKEILQCPLHWCSRSNWIVQKYNSTHTKKKTMCWMGSSLKKKEKKKNIDTYTWNKQHSYSTSFQRLIQS